MNSITKEELFEKADEIALNEYNKQKEVDNSEEKFTKFLSLDAPYNNGLNPILDTMEKLRNLPRLNQHLTKNQVYLDSFELSANFFQIKLVGVNEKDEIEQKNICYWLTVEPSLNDCDNMYELMFLTCSDAIDFYLKIKNL